MKAKLLKMLVVLAVAGLAASTTLAQNAPANVPQLSDGARQVVQLAQAKLGDDTIIAYIKNSGNRYVLDANQIIYLRQQGVSEMVIATMLRQPKPATTYIAPTLSAPPPTPAAVGTEPVSTVSVAPTVTYVQPSPVTYYQPAPVTYYSDAPYCYPVYNGYPTVSFGLGLGLGWLWGHGWDHHGGGGDGHHGGHR